MGIETVSTVDIVYMVSILTVVWGGFGYCLVELVRDRGSDRGS